MDVVRHLPLSQSADRSADAAVPDRRDLVAVLVASIIAAEPNAAERARFAAQRVDLDRLSAPRRVTSQDLVRLVREALAFGDARGRALDIDPRTIGAAALAASASAPADRRAAISGYTVTASDAGWSFGRGPVAAASAIDIVRFLVGLSDVPPKPERR